jgi:hypothetical protein
MSFHRRKKSDDKHLKCAGNENYWKERVELHIDEKKQWMKQKKDLHVQISRISDKIDMLEKRNKHLTGVINRFGAFDNYEAEFSPK